MKGFVTLETYNENNHTVKKYLASSSKDANESQGLSEKMVNNVCPWQDSGRVKKGVSSR